MKRFSLIFTLLALAFTAVAQPQIAAHRGYHREDGAPRNSIAALRDAHSAGFEWLEIDVLLSSDGVPMALHGPWHPQKKEGIWVQTSTKAEIQGFPLSNGEAVPTLDEMLKEVARLRTIGVIIDIKPHNTPEAQDEVIAKITKTVSKYDLQDKVLYMTSIERSFRQLKKLNKRTDNILFTHGSYSATWRASLGCKYIGYSHIAWGKKPEALADCALLGVKTVAWTPNNEEDIRKMVDMGIDIIISDYPMLVREVIKKYHK